MGRIEHWFGAVFLVVLILVGIGVWLSTRSTGPDWGAGGAQASGQIEEPTTAGEAYCACFDRAYSYSRDEQHDITSFQYGGGLLLCRHFSLFDDQGMGVDAWSRGWEAGVAALERRRDPAVFGSCGRAYRSYLDRAAN